MQRTLYIFRHGETNENRDGVRYGLASGGYLTERGIAQAEYLSAELANAPIDIFFSSPYMRATDTVKIVARQHPNAGIITDDRLREGVYFWWRTNDIDAKQKSRETYSRVCSAMTDIFRSGFSNIAISSHGGISRAILRYCGHRVGTIKNCECICLTMQDGKWIITRRIKPHVSNK